MNSNIFEVLFPIFVLVIAVGIIAWLLSRIKKAAKSGASMRTTLHGTLYETYIKEKQASVKQVLEQKVKKLNEQKSDKLIE